MYTAYKQGTVQITHIANYFYFASWLCNWLCKNTIYKSISELCLQKVIFLVRFICNVCTVTHNATLHMYVCIYVCTQHVIFTPSKYRFAKCFKHMYVPSYVPRYRAYIYMCVPSSLVCHTFVSQHFPNHLCAHYLYYQLTCYLSM